MKLAPASLTFREFIETGLARSARWHRDGDKRTIADWACSLAGEAGEVCNAVNKLRRLEDGDASLNEPGRHLATREEAVRAIADEIADVLIYAPLLAAKLGIDLEAALIRKFNAVSERYGFPERLGEPSA